MAKILLSKLEVDPKQLEAIYPATLDIDQTGIVGVEYRGHVYHYKTAEQGTTMTLTSDPDKRIQFTLTREGEYQTVCKLYGFGVLSKLVRQIELTF